MNIGTFDIIKQEFNNHEEKLLGVKRSEYADDIDVLVNFKEVSRMLGISPEKYCLSMTAKHFHAIKRAVDADKYDWCWSGEIGEGLKQRIADLRNYALLLAALIEERVGPSDVITITIAGVGNLGEKISP